MSIFQYETFNDKENFHKHKLVIQFLTYYNTTETFTI